MHLLYKEPYLYCSELHIVQLHYVSKLWCNEHNLDIIWADVNMYNEDIVC